METADDFEDVHRMCKKCVSDIDKRITRVHGTAVGRKTIDFPSKGVKAIEIANLRGQRFAYKRIADVQCKDGDKSVMLVAAIQYLRDTLEYGLETDSESSVERWKAFCTEWLGEHLKSVE